MHDPIDLVIDSEEIPNTLLIISVPEIERYYELDHDVFLNKLNQNIEVYRKDLKFDPKKTVTMITEEKILEEQIFNDSFFVDMPEQINTIIPMYMMECCSIEDIKCFILFQYMTYYIASHSLNLILDKRPNIKNFGLVLPIKNYEKKKWESSMIFGNPKRLKLIV